MHVVLNERSGFKHTNIKRKGPESDTHRIVGISYADTIANSELELVKARFLSAANCSAVTSEGDNRIIIPPAGSKSRSQLAIRVVKRPYRQDFFASNYGQTI
jgi:hypothetical protein